MQVARLACIPLRDLLIRAQDPVTSIFCYYILMLLLWDVFYLSSLWFTMIYLCFNNSQKGERSGAPSFTVFCRKPGWLEAFYNEGWWMFHERQLRGVRLW